MGAAMDMPEDKVHQVMGQHLSARLADACMNQDPVTVSELLALGADPNLPDCEGRLALHAAVFEGNMEVMSRLLDSRASADLVEGARGGGTPLQIAAWQGHAAAARTLLEARADPNAPNTKGETPLYSAALMGHRQTAQVLLDRGSDANRPALVGNRKITPLQAAVEARHADVANLIKNRSTINSSTVVTSRFNGLVKKFQHKAHEVGRCGVFGKRQICSLPQ